MRIVVDTGVFYHPAALRSLADMRADVVVPVVVFMERARQLERRGRDARAFAVELRAGGYVIEPFDTLHAVRFAVRMVDDDSWRKHFRDAMIAGHVGPDDELWTTNRKDFELIGVAPRQIRDVP